MTTIFALTVLTVKRLRESVTGIVITYLKAGVNKSKDNSKVTNYPQASELFDTL